MNVELKKKYNNLILVNITPKMISACTSVFGLKDLFLSIQILNFLIPFAAKWPARLNIGISLFFSIFFLYVLRANFSINILAMIEPTTLDEHGNLIELPDVSGIGF